MSARRLAGEIVYNHALGVRGRERFDIDIRPNGRTVRAYCIMANGQLTRDASWTLDAEHRPVEAQVRVVRKGELVGATSYRFTDEETHCEALTAALGRVSQVLPGRRDYVGLHPLVGDGMIAIRVGTANPGVRVEVPSVTCSYDIEGESSLLALPITIGVTYLGPEEIEVPAGRFAAQHFLLEWGPDWPPARLWVDPDDYVTLRLSWEVSGLTSELVSFGEGWSL
ncbi:hypothetical protein B2G71_22575 [Novosphingobium sp. PC22D]|uniref:hypothetical protein n=1 Tax=Novosphingobium sp. PC22D TaxID=1962403 RepID=UPI000BF23517|nr:hypothetical protein [Novosphingobium sp. PC22D]PEQ10410.1 hypothetical protein B2G71_22575 [Novosphingobium sp. PC22D]